jgi:hypothetical protein
LGLRKRVAIATCRSIRNKMPDEIGCNQKSYINATKFYTSKCLGNVNLPCGDVL